MTRNFRKMLTDQFLDGRVLCVGLDPDLAQIDPDLHAKLERKEVDPTSTLIYDAIAGFNNRIIAGTHSAVAAYKPNVCYYEEQLRFGLDIIKSTIFCARHTDRRIVTIVDLKKGDIAASNEGSARMVFDRMDADAVTVNPLLGGEALQPFLRRKDKGIFVLCRTSNPGAQEFQKRMTLITDEEAERWGLPQGTLLPFYQLIAYRVSQEWNEHGNCGLVVGATAPEELAAVRRIVGEKMLLLSPGVGKQGGDRKKAVHAGMNSQGGGILINVSSGVTSHPEPGSAAKTLNIAVYNDLKEA